MKLMCGIELWGGLSALLILFVTKPGPLAQAGMDAGLWPSTHRVRRPNEIPLPALATFERQRCGLIPTLADGQGAEALQMETGRALLPRFEAKIQRVLDRGWGNGIELSEPKEQPRAQVRQPMNTLQNMSLAGFKSIREMRDLEFKALNVLIGANGAGKSNLIGFIQSNARGSSEWSSWHFAHRRRRFPRRLVSGSSVGSNRADWSRTRQQRVDRMIPSGKM